VNTTTQCLIIIGCAWIGIGALLSLVFGKFAHAQDAEDSGAK